MNIDEAMRRSRAAVARLLDVCARPGRIVVVMQDNPDPDALACAMTIRDLAQQRLRKRVAIGYAGICGRAENRAMIETLRIDARRMNPSELAPFRTVCLVDAQPASGNSDVLGGRRPDVVIDHHLVRRGRPIEAELVDIRPDYGATSTILYEYAKAADIKISTALATALFYGIQSDTQDLGREFSPSGLQAYQELFLLADKRKLAHIRRAPVPAAYFCMLADSLANCLIAGNTVISCIRNCVNADMIPEVADLLMRLEGMRRAVCYGLFESDILISARAADARGNMAQQMRRVVAHIGSGGGHRTMAGGHVPGGELPQQRLEQVQERILRVFAPGKTPIPLTSARR
ncbi:MAG TPA: DHH family phosphoesterase [Candidatus Hydrogenedentes bacterium]|nr:DHH family phosphoesterase [Candidatus Hydrogenedentota bacterium]